MNIKMLRAVLMVLLFLNFILIFMLSAQEGTMSSGISGEITKSVISIFKMDSGYYHVIETIVRKSAHFMLYMLSGILSFGILKTYKLDSKLKVSISILICTFYATFDEIHQLFVEGRSGLLSDVFIDMVGATFGIIIVIMTSKVFSKKRKNIKK